MRQNSVAITNFRKGQPFSPPVVMDCIKLENSWGLNRRSTSPGHKKSSNMLTLSAISLEGACAGPAIETEATEFRNQYH